MEMEIKSGTRTVVACPPPPQTQRPAWPCPARVLGGKVETEAPKLLQMRPMSLTREVAV